MSEELKKDFKETFESLKELEMEELLLARGFTLGLKAAQEINNDRSQCVEK